jgi:hypothetical protein
MSKSEAPSDKALARRQFKEAAKHLFHAAEGTLKIKLAFDTEWRTEHPHTLGIWDDEGPMRTLKFADATDAKHAYDAINSTFYSLYMRHKFLGWVRHVLSGVVVVAFIGLVIAWVIALCA